MTIKRGVLMLLPESLNDFVSEDNAVRVVDAFIEGMGDLLQKIEMWVKIRTELSPPM